MAAAPWSTHTVEVGPDTVTKRFRPGCRDRCAREWCALTLLSRYAPGTAPEPLSVRLDAAEPVVAMSRLDGEPLRSRALDAVLIRSPARTVESLHTALPPWVLARVPPRPGRRAAVLEFVRTRAPHIRPGLTGRAARTLDEGLDWVAGVAWEEDPGPVPTVFGPGDGNLANYLWDGSRERVVDFEDSGRSDRAFEPAEITEHVGGWVEHPLNTAAFLDGFALTPAEASRLHECRCLLALVRLVLLCLDEAGEGRNQPGTADRQARRLAALLEGGV